MKKGIAVILILFCGYAHALQNQADDEVRLEVVSEHVGPLIGPGHPGTEDNKSGFETGCALLHNGIYHVFVNEMFGKAHRELRISHWYSEDGSAWKRKGTVFESIPGRSPYNQRSELWVQCVIFNEVENRWNMFYVAYRGGNEEDDEVAGLDYDGKIWRAVSLTEGKDGIDGPYQDVDIVMRPGENSLPWEGQQGVDSFFPWQAGDHWYAFYGSHYHHPRGSWMVGMAESPTLMGPWKRIPERSPYPLVKNFTENPIVQRVSEDYWLVVYDSESPNAIGYSFSSDGINWSPETVLIVQSEDNRWAGDDGLREVRTPLGLLPLGEDRYILLYTAKMKDRKIPFYGIGQCIVRLKLPE